MAQINCLDSRAGQTTSHPTTPPSPCYEEGANFCCCACQGCKKLAGIKMPINYAYEDKTLSIIQTNCAIKDVKDEKTTKVTNINDLY
jgi:hypothetical protein